MPRPFSYASRLALAAVLAASGAAIATVEPLPGASPQTGRLGASYPVALDPKLTIGNTFGFKGTPYTVVIDRRGEMVSQIHGASAVSRLPRILDELLKANPPPSS